MWIESLIQRVKYYYGHLFFTLLLGLLSVFVLFFMSFDSTFLLGALVSVFLDVDVVVYLEALSFIALLSIITSWVVLHCWNSSYLLLLSSFFTSITIVEEAAAFYLAFSSLFGRKENKVDYLGVFF